MESCSMTSCVWLLLSTLFLWDSSTFSYVFVDCSFSLLYSVPLCEYTTIYLLLLMEILAISNFLLLWVGMLWNILVLVFWWTYVLISIRHTPRSGNVGSWDMLIFRYYRCSQKVFQNLYQFILLPLVHESFSCSI